MVEWDSDTYKQLLESFQSELEEEIQVVTDAVLTLEKKPSQESYVTLLETILRTTHNIKGTARSIELQPISEIAHCLENLFEQLKTQNKSISNQVVETTFHVLDSMREALQCAFEHQLDRFDVKKILQFIAKVNVSKLSQRLQKNIPVSDKEVSDKEAVIKKEEHPDVQQKSAPTEAEEQPEEPSFIALQEPDSIRVSMEKISELSALSDSLQSIKLSNLDAYTQLRQINAPFEQVISSLKAMKLHKRSDRFKAVMSAISHFKHHLFQIERDLHELSSQLEYSTNALQDEIRLMRLVPASVILRPLLRVARDIAKACDKEVNLTIDGDQIEVDRVVLNKIKDPLIHLIRNAIDHGIEAPNERQKKGKSPMGEIHIQVSKQGAHVLMIVTDDGAGINVDAIVQSAISKKILTQEELAHYTSEQRLNLIFLPGVSSKKLITETSGRGVGLDVVRSNVQSLKGEVEISSTKDQGTSIQLYLPVTLLTDRGTFVEVNSTIFVLPTTSIKRVLHLDISEVHTVESGYAILFNGELVPLYRLSELLGLTDAAAVPTQYFSIVVIAKGPMMIGLVVDAVMGEKEIVVRPLKYPMTTVKNISGVTLTRKGDVLVVLNPIDLMDTALYSRSTLEFSEASTLPQRRECILVVDDSITTRTLEVNILTAQGYDVIGAVNGEEAWKILQQQPVDLVVTDILMPVMDGFELTKLIKHSEQLSTIPVIVVTSKASDEDKKHGVEVGADAYLVKNEFESKHLIETIEHLI